MDSFFQSHDSMFGDKRAALTATAMTAKAMLFMQPLPRETLPTSTLQYLSASLKTASWAAAAPPANAFSFYVAKNSIQRVLLNALNY